MASLLVGWRYKVFTGCILGAITIALYPIIVDPILNTEKYKKQQALNRKDVKQEDIQPGNMRIWSNPFEPIKDK